MRVMFAGVRSFNGDMSMWDVSSGIDTRVMFSGVRSFKGDMSTWDVSSGIDKRVMFAGVRPSCFFGS